MTKRQRVEAVYRLEKADRIPFAPAIYEHKGKLVGKTPSEICRNAEALYAGLKAELAVYDPDLLVIGIDVYNVEAEAMGCQVVYFENSDEVPAIVEPLIKNASDLGRLGVPDPDKDGRMPLYLQVAETLGKEIGGEVIIRGAVTGPFSMAASLVGVEKLLMATVEEPEFVEKLLSFCAKVTLVFGKGFLARGVEPIIFDSQATPQIASPRVFRQFVMPLYRDVVLPELKAAGGRFLPLIIGGNTTPIIDDLLATGATQFLSDRPANLAKWCEKALAARMPVRANVDSRLVHSGPTAAVRKQAMEILRDFHAHPGFLLGCGIVTYNGNPEHVHAIRHAIEDVARGGVDFEKETA